MKYDYYRYNSRTYRYLRSYGWPRALSAFIAFIVKAMIWLLVVAAIVAFIYFISKDSKKNRYPYSGNKTTSSSSYALKEWKR